MSITAIMDTLFGTPTAVGANYSQFITSYYSPRALLCVIFFFALFDYIENCSSCGAVHASPFLQSCTLVMSWVALGGLCTVWLLKAHSDREHTSKVTPPQQLILPAIQGITPVLVTICNSALALNILYGSVDGNEIQLNMATSALKIYPLLTYFLLRDTWYQSVMFAWAMGICTCFWCASYLHRPERVCEQFVYTVGTGLVLCYSYRQDQDIFNLVTELQATTKVNEELAIEAQALELRAMIGNVAHDLKTPLTSFLWGVEYMREILSSWKTKLDFGSDQQALAEYCKKAAENVAALQKCLTCMESTNSFMTMTINRCLDYTKASKGVKLVPKYETVHLEEEIRFATQLISDTHSAAALEVSQPGWDICSHIITDRQWLVENLLCLLSNAVKYSDKGTVNLDAYLFDTQPGERQLRFEVLDTGIGISEEAMANLFAPFKQAQRLAGGTGLGLYSLAMRVEALQGQYGVSKRPDGAQGSLFWFTIPYRRDEMSAQAAREAGKRGGRSGSFGSSTKSADSACQSVLVVDDAPMIVKMTSMLLARKGHTVQHAVNGAEALDKIQQGYSSRNSSDGELQLEPFDVVLMDLQMPVLDGIEAIRRLRAAEEKLIVENKEKVINREQVDFMGQAEVELPQSVSETIHVVSHPHQFVIALSANSDEGTRQEALEAGADAFIGKPFKYEYFQSEVRAKTQRE